MEYSITTLQIVAWSKVLLIVTLGAMILCLRKYPRPWLVSLILSLSVTSFYLILSKPLARMWWATNGDEIFIVSFLTQVLKGNPLADFYYHGLPPFYPPLYFWVTGLISRPFVEGAIGAAKIGIAATMFLWFFGTYHWTALWKRFAPPVKSPILESAWFWLAIPVTFFCLLDFDTLILKPYETLPALGLAIFVGIFAISLSANRWTYREYLFFGISGGLLFLSYYFWWFLAIPTLFLLAWTSKDKLKNSLRVVGMGAIMFAVAAIYLLPLFWSYRGGLENWQALYFVPHDFDTFLPFLRLSWKTPIILAGIIGLIAHHRQPLVRANIMLLGMGFLYQFISILLFLGGGHPLQAAKPFLFLGTTSIAVGAAHLIVNLWQKYVVTLPIRRQIPIMAGLLIFTLPFLPMTTFIDDPVVRMQIEKDLEPSGAFYLSKEIEKAVPDYADRVWLSSGIPDINAYLPLHYFVAHNPHFSHPVSKYSGRLAVIEEMSTANQEVFTRLIDEAGINALLLYTGEQSDMIPFFFWADNYPNGGKENRIDIPQDRFENLGWRVAHENPEWRVLIKE